MDSADPQHGTTTALSPPPHHRSTFDTVVNEDFRADDDGTELRSGVREEGLLWRYRRYSGCAYWRTRIYVMSYLCYWPYSSDAVSKSLLGTFCGSNLELPSVSEIATSGIHDDLVLGRRNAVPRLGGRWAVLGLHAISCQERRMNARCDA